METAKSRTTGESMRVAIVCSSRTGASAVEGIYANKFKLEGLSEFFASGTKYGEKIEDRVQWLRENDNYVAKFTSSAFLDNGLLNYQKFPWQIFDKIVLVERDIKYQLSSWLLLSHAQTKAGLRDNAEIVKFLTEILERNPLEIEVNKSQMHSILVDVNRYYDMKTYLLKKYKKVKLIPTEILEIVDEEKKLAELSSITGFRVKNKHISKKGVVPNYDLWINAHKLEDIINEMKQSIKQDKQNAKTSNKTGKPKRKKQRTV